MGDENHSPSHCTADGDFTVFLDRMIGIGERQRKRVAEDRCGFHEAETMFPEIGRGLVCAPLNGHTTEVRRSVAGSRLSSSAKGLLRLAGQQDQGFQCARALLFAEDQIAAIAFGEGVNTVRPWSSTSTLPGSDNEKYPRSGPHGVEHRGQIPRRPVVGHRHVVAIGVGHWMVGDPAEIVLDAERPGTASPGQFQNR